MSKFLLEARGNYYKFNTTDDLATAIVMNKSVNPISFAVVSADGAPIDRSENVILIQAFPRKINAFEKANHINTRTDEGVAFYTLLKYYFRRASTPQYLALLKTFGKKLVSEGLLKIHTFPSAQKAAIHGMTKLKLHPQVLSTAFGVSSIESLIGDSQEDGHHVSIGDTILYYPDNMRKNRLDGIVASIEKANKILESKGFGFLTKGKMIVAPITAQSTAALYFPTEKMIKIDPGTKFAKDTISNTLHEYGHKLYYEFLSTKARDAIRSMYTTAITSTPTSDYGARSNIQKEISRRVSEIAKNLIVPGDELVYKGRKKDFKRASPFTITSVDAERGYMRAATASGSPIAGPIESFFNKGFEIKGKPLKIDLRDIEEETKDREGWFPSVYSRKNHEEWFSEIFAHYLLGETNSKDIASFIKEIVRMS